MRIISTPASLRAAASLFLLSIPLAGIQVMLGSRAYWWRLPIREIALACGLAAFLAVPLVAALSRGRAVAYTIAVTISMLWSIASFVVALKQSHTVLGYFAILLAAFLYVTLHWIRFELSRSYLDPRQAWFQGSPKEIAGLSCKLLGVDDSPDFRVCRLDSEGAYVFAREPNAQITAGTSGVSQLQFRFRDSEIRCSAIARGALSAGAGAGFQFVDLSPDLRKEIGDFVEMLRGEGYVD